MSAKNKTILFVFSGQQHENKQCTVDKPKCVNCKGEHPSSSKTCPKKIEKLLVMKKVLVEKCTPQQARVEIKTQLKPAKYSILVFGSFILGNLPKMSAKNKTILFVFSVSEGILTLVTLPLGLFVG
jgi:hypothetical protein